jgi:alpha-tubulin suppressor-like RCC1 family protein
MIGAAHLMMRQSGQPKGLFTWGVNFTGNLALGDSTKRSSPVQVGALTDWTAIIGAGSQYDRDWTLFLKSDGTAWACGADTCGQLGLGVNGVSYSSPVQIGAATDWSQLSTGYSGGTGVMPPNFYGGMSAGIRSGKLYTWGRNYQGEMGVGDTTRRSSPTQVGTDTDWSKVVAGNIMLALKTTGTLWAWGYNTNGELGLGDRTPRSSPVQVGSDTNWTDISHSRFVSYAIKTTGTLWAWGWNFTGELGLGDLTNRSSPTQVGSDTNWAKVRAGNSFCLAIRANGTLWAWGKNTVGQLGLGDRTSRSSPVQVGSDTDWSDIYGAFDASYALKTNGTLWAWGENAYGQLGIGNQVYMSSPVQVGSGTNWTTIMSTGVQSSSHSLGQ